MAIYFSTRNATLSDVESYNTSIPTFQKTNGTTGIFLKNSKTINTFTSSILKDIHSLAFNLSTRNTNPSGTLNLTISRIITGGIVTDTSTNTYYISSANVTKSFIIPYKPKVFWGCYIPSGNTTIATNNGFIYPSGTQFTMEGWVNTESWSSGQYRNMWGTHDGIGGWIFGTNPSNALTLWHASGVIDDTVAITSRVSLNTWNHYAVTRDSNNNISLYVNGTRVISAAGARNYNNTSSITVGTAVNNTGVFGTYSNLRFIKNQALYTGTSFIPPTGNLTSTSVGTQGPGVASSITGTVELLTYQNSYFVNNGTSLPTTFTGGSMVASSLYNTNESYVPSLYNGSLIYNGTNSFLTLTGSPFTFLHDGTTDYTVECWLNKYTATQQVIMGTTTLLSTGVGWCLRSDANNNIIAQINNGTVANSVLFPSSSTVYNNNWNHIALTFDSATKTGRFYLNGVAAGSASKMAGTYNTSTAFSAFYIGVGANGANYFNGSISDIRIIKGYKYYTSNFTVSTVPLTNVSNTVLLLNYTNNNVILSSVFAESYPISGFTSADTTNNIYSPYSQNYQLLGTNSTLTLSTGVRYEISLNTSDENQLSFIGDTQPVDYTYNNILSTNRVIGLSSIKFFNKNVDAQVFTLSSTIAIPNTQYVQLYDKDFTIECWINISTLENRNQKILILQNGTSNSNISYALGINSLNIPVFNAGIYNSLSGISATNSINANTWYHLAVVKTNNFNFYINGTNVGSLSSNLLINNFSTGNLFIGSNNTTSEFFAGNLTNLKISTSALYTTNFDPPSAQELTIDANTNLIVQNGFNYNKHLNTNIAILTGNSINTAGRLTNNLTPFTTTVEPSCISIGTGAGGANASHGIPNLVNTFDWNSDFTLECFVYFCKYSAAGYDVQFLGFRGGLQGQGYNENVGMFCRNGTSGQLSFRGGGSGGLTQYGNNPSLSTWYHAAFVRDVANGNFRLYWNGNWIGTWNGSFTYPSNNQECFIIGSDGADFVANYSNVRLSKNQVYTGTTTYQIPTKPFDFNLETVALVNYPYGNKFKYLNTRYGAFSDLNVGGYLTNDSLSSISLTADNETSNRTIDNINVYNGGVLEFPTYRSKSLLITGKPGVQIHSGGTFNIGSINNPVLSSYTSVLLLSSNSLIVHEGGNLNMYGSYRTPFAYLSTDSIATNRIFYTNINVSDTWRSGDNIILIPNISAGNSFDNLTLSTFNTDIYGTSSFRTTSNSLFAHNSLGSVSYVPTVSNVTRNVLISSYDNTNNRSFVGSDYLANVNIDSVKIVDMTNGFGFKSGLIKNSVIENSYDDTPTYLLLSSASASFISPTISSYSNIFYRSSGLDLLLLESPLFNFSNNIILSSRSYGLNLRGAIVDNTISNNYVVGSFGYGILIQNLSTNSNTYLPVTYRNNTGIYINNLSAANLITYYNLKNGIYYDVPTNGFIYNISAFNNGSTGVLINGNNINSLITTNINSINNLSSALTINSITLSSLSSTYTYCTYSGIILSAYNLGNIYFDNNYIRNGVSALGISMLSSLSITNLSSNFNTRSNTVYISSANVNTINLDSLNITDNLSGTAISIFVNTLTSANLTNISAFNNRSYGIVINGDSANSINLNNVNVTNSLSSNLLIKFNSGTTNLSVLNLSSDNSKSNDNVFISINNSNNTLLSNHNISNNLSGNALKLYTNLVSGINIENINANNNRGYGMVLSSASINNAILNNLNFNNSLSGSLQLTTGAVSSLSVVNFRGSDTSAVNNVFLSIPIGSYLSLDTLTLSGNLSGNALRINNNVLSGINIQNINAYGNRAYGMVLSSASINSAILNNLNFNNSLSGSLQLTTGVVSSLSVVNFRGSDTSAVNNVFLSIPIGSYLSLDTLTLSGNLSGNALRINNNILSGSDIQNINANNNLGYGMVLSSNNISNNVLLNNLNFNNNLSGSLQLTTGAVSSLSVVNILGSDTRGTDSMFLSLPIGSYLSLNTLTLSGNLSGNALKINNNILSGVSIQNITAPNNRLNGLVLSSNNISNNVLLNNLNFNNSLNGSLQISLSTVPSLSVTNISGSNINFLENALLTILNGTGTIDLNNLTLTNNTVGNALKVNSNLLSSINIQNINASNNIGYGLSLSSINIRNNAIFNNLNLNSNLSGSLQLIIGGVSGLYITNILGSSNTRGTDNVFLSSFAANYISLDTLTLSGNLSGNALRINNNILSGVSIQNITALNNRGYGMILSSNNISNNVLLNNLNFNNSLSGSLQLTTGVVSGLSVINILGSNTSAVDNIFLNIPIAGFVSLDTLTLSGNLSGNALKINNNILSGVSIQNINATNNRLNGLILSSNNINNNALFNNLNFNNSLNSSLQISLSTVPSLSVTNVSGSNTFGLESALVTILNGRGNVDLNNLTLTNNTVGNALKINNTNLLSSINIQNINASNNRGYGVSLSGNIIGTNVLLNNLNLNSNLSGSLQLLFSSISSLSVTNILGSDTRGVDNVFLSSFAANYISFDTLTLSGNLSGNALRSFTNLVSGINIQNINAYNNRAYGMVLSSTNINNTLLNNLNFNNSLSGSLQLLMSNVSSLSVVNFRGSDTSAVDNMFLNIPIGSYLDLNTLTLSGNLSGNALKINNNILSGVSIQNINASNNRLNGLVLSSTNINNALFNNLNFNNSLNGSLQISLSTVPSLSVTNVSGSNAFGLENALFNILSSTGTIDLNNLTLTNNTIGNALKVNSNLLSSINIQNINASNNRGYGLSLSSINIRNNAIFNNLNLNSNLSGVLQLITGSVSSLSVTNILGSDTSAVNNVFLSIPIASYVSLNTLTLSGNLSGNALRINNNILSGVDIQNINAYSNRAYGMVLSSNNISNNALFNNLNFNNSLSGSLQLITGRISGLSVVNFRGSNTSAVDNMFLHVPITNYLSLNTLTLSGNLSGNSLRINNNILSGVDIRNINAPNNRGYGLILSSTNITNKPILNNLNFSNSLSSGLTFTSFNLLSGLTITNLTANNSLNGTVLSSVNIGDLVLINYNSSNTNNGTGLQILTNTLSSLSVVNLSSFNNTALGLYLTSSNIGPININNANLANSLSGGLFLRSSILSSISINGLSATNGRNTNVILSGYTANTLTLNNIDTTNSLSGGLFVGVNTLSSVLMTNITASNNPIHGIKIVHNNLNNTTPINVKTNNVVCNNSISGIGLEVYNIYGELSGLTLNNNYIDGIRTTIGNAETTFDGVVSNMNNVWPLSTGTPDNGTVPRLSSLNPYGVDYNNLSAGLYFNDTASTLITYKNIPKALTDAAINESWSLELWFYPITTAGMKPLISTLGGTIVSLNVGWYVGIIDGKLFWYTQGLSNNANFTAKQTIYNVNANQWNHVLICRDVNLFTVYLNGISALGYSDNTAFQRYDGTGQVGGKFSVGGGDDGGLQWYNGYISNIRIVKSALYRNNTLTIPIPRTPHLILSNTAFLLSSFGRWVYTNRPNNPYNINILSAYNYNALSIKNAYLSSYSYSNQVNSITSLDLTTNLNINTITRLEEINFENCSFYSQLPFTYNLLNRSYFEGSMLFNNCLLTVPISTFVSRYQIGTGLHTGIAVMNDQKISNNHYTIDPIGKVSLDSIVFNSVGPSEKLEPNHAYLKLKSNPKLIPLNAGDTINLNVFCKKSLNYTGDAPRLMVKHNATLGYVDSVLATSVSGNDVWELLSGTIPPAFGTGLAEVYVDCGGLSASGWINIDDWDFIS